MMANGTKIVRDHALMRERFSGNQRGNKTISGGTAGHCSYEI